MTDMAGWLALHGVTAAQCAALIPAPAALPRPEDPALPPVGLWAEVTAALARALPDVAAVLTRLGAAARVDLAPDPVRFPRAFTLADDGSGLPFVSCPLQGRLSDLLRLAHEAGHACQYLAAGRADLTPILRETAAHLAEEALCDARATPDPTRRAALLALLLWRRERVVRRHADALRAALTQPGASYDYGWNYPPAVRLASLVRQDAGLIRRVLDGRITLPDLIARIAR